MARGRKAGPTRLDLRRQGEAAEAREGEEVEKDDDEEKDEDDEDDEDDEEDLDDDELLELDRLPDPTRDAGPRRVLPTELVAELERALLLLPLRVRLEALVAAGELVDGWADLLADHEKALGHLVLSHAEPQLRLGHEALADRHAVLHAGGPGHEPHEA